MSAPTVHHTNSNATGSLSFELTATDTKGRRYRYYLVWITKLPPDEGRVEITQVTLSAPKT